MSASAPSLTPQQMAAAQRWAAQQASEQEAKGVGTPPAAPASARAVAGLGGGSHRTPASASTARALTARASGPSDASRTPLNMAGASALLAHSMSAAVLSGDKQSHRRRRNPHAATPQPYSPKSSASPFKTGPLRSAEAALQGSVSTPNIWAGEGGRGATGDFTPSAQEDGKSAAQGRSPSARRALRDKAAELAAQSAQTLSRNADSELLGREAWKRSLSPAQKHGALSAQRRSSVKAHNARQVTGIVPFPEEQPASADHGPRPALLQAVQRRLDAALAGLGISGADNVQEVDAALADSRAEAVLNTFRDAFQGLIEGFTTYQPILQTIRRVYEQRLRSVHESALSVPALVAQLASAEQDRHAALTEQAERFTAQLDAAKQRVAAAEAASEAASSRVAGLQEELAEAQEAAEAARSALAELRTNNSALIAAYRRTELTAQEAEAREEVRSREVQDLRAALSAVETENQGLESSLERRAREVSSSVPISSYERVQRSLTARSDELREVKAAHAKLQADHTRLVTSLRKRGAGAALAEVQGEWMTKLADALDLRARGSGEGLNPATGSTGLPGDNERLRGAVHRVMEGEGGDGGGEGGHDFALLVRMLSRIEELKAHIKGASPRRRPRTFLSTISEGGGGGEGLSPRGRLAGSPPHSPSSPTAPGIVGLPPPSPMALGSRGTVYVPRPGASLALPPGSAPSPRQSPVPNAPFRSTTVGGTSIVRESVGSAGAFGTVLPHPALNVGPLPSGMVVHAVAPPEAPSPQAGGGSSPPPDGPVDRPPHSTDVPSMHGVPLAVLGPGTGAFLPPAQLPHYFNPLLPTPVVLSTPPPRPGAPHGSTAWAQHALTPPAPVYRLASVGELQHTPQGGAAAGTLPSAPPPPTSPRKGRSEGGGATPSKPSSPGDSSAQGQTTPEPTLPPLSLVPFDVPPSVAAALAMPPHSTALRLSHILNGTGDARFNPGALPVPFTSTVFRQRFFIGRGTHPSVPKYLRCHGIIRNRFLSKRATERLVKQCWVAKEQAEAELRGAGTGEEGGGGAITRVRVRSVKTASGTHRIPLQGFFLSFLTQKYGTRGAAQEWAYSLIHALRRYVYDSDCEIFLRVLQGRLPEEVHHHSLKLVTNLRDSLVETDKSTNGGQATGILPKDVLRQHVRLLYRTKSPAMMATLLAELERDANAAGDSVDYNELLSEDADGDQGEFVEMLRAQALKEYQTYTAEITGAIAAAAGEDSGGRGSAGQFIKVSRIASAIRSCDPDKPSDDVAALIRRGWTGGRSMSTEALLSCDSTITLAPFLIRLREGWLERSTGRL